MAIVRTQNNVIDNKTVRDLGGNQDTDSGGGVELTAHVAIGAAAVGDPATTEIADAWSPMKVLGQLGKALAAFGVFFGLIELAFLVANGSVIFPNVLNAVWVLVVVVVFISGLDLYRKGYL